MTNEGTWLPVALQRAGLVRSASEGRRMIACGAVSVDGRRAADTAAMLAPGTHILAVCGVLTVRSAKVRVPAPRPAKKPRYTCAGAMAPVEERPLTYAVDQAEEGTAKIWREYPAERLEHLKAQVAEWPESAKKRVRRMAK